MVHKISELNKVFSKHTKLIFDSKVMQKLNNRSRVVHLRMAGRLQKTARNPIHLYAEIFKINLELNILLPNTFW
jgi:CRISPR/Cas system Type II protein with McrA/HNH and RuvC-like nuclease domain